MPPVLEALPSKKIPTASNYYNEWLTSSFNEDAPVIQVDRQIKFPELSMCIVERPDGNWVLINGETSGSGRSVEHLELDIVDDIESPIMPPKRKFRISVRVKSIKKGRPSICDEVEHE